MVAGSVEVSALDYHAEQLSSNPMEGVNNIADTGYQQCALLISVNGIPVNRLRISAI